MKPVHRIALLSMLLPGIAACGDPCIDDICYDVLYVALALPPGDRTFEVTVQTTDGSTTCVLDLPLTTATPCSNAGLPGWEVEDFSTAIFAFQNPRSVDFVISLDDAILVEQTVTPVERDFRENPDTAHMCTPCYRADIFFNASGALLP